jgi:hypothetical protein
VAAKQCTKCGETKPVEKFYRQNGGDGWRPECKVCTAEYNRQYKLARNYVAPSTKKAKAAAASRKAERIAERQQRLDRIGDRQCCDCKETLPLTKFRAYRSGNRAHQCEACRNKRQRARSRAAGAEWAVNPYGRRDKEASRKRIQVWRAKRKASGLRDRPYEQRLRDGVARAAKAGKEYWPAGCRLTKPKLKPASLRMMAKPWHGIRDDNERFRLKWHHSYEFRIYHRVKRWMQKHLRDERSSKVWSHKLGYTPSELKRHLERQFTRGMGWHNMGEWHIDHIVPVREFNFDTADCPDFRAAYSLSNLRPVWARENLAKSGRRLFLC